MRDTDLRSLQRLSGPRRRSRRRSLVVRQVGGAPAATRRPAVPRWVTLALVTVVCAASYVGVAATQQVDEDEALAHVPAAPPAEGAVAAEPRREVTRADRASRGTLAALGEEAEATGGDADLAGATVFARVDDVALGLPHPAPVAVAFHEASRAEALELEPLGRLEGNDNTTKFTAPEDREGPAYRVLSSRGRARPATSAVDVVLPDGATVLSPVSGTVVEARDYLLYGSLRDWRVVIAPDERSDLQVVLIHLHQPVVEAGDRVTAGAPLAVVRQLPFTSHVDYVVGERSPHVHVEVRPATAPKPHDPNEPAMDARERLEEVTGTRSRNS